ncbi:DUF885 domain-containing protein [Umboniibacter marinipuniceus]|uniref:Uncharacterized protein (DUF885 family) n=1 Tax=Umboniibacter marinipuniceus TaxID=569599 RepID=A0A3M0A261_9GAMM|nr:DUF885 domain-containing protein [Umboniibacter marinipuniceus]RMA78736.1 uncharacterized protein (DUF885 family) [Umboniibacter marinipuniceus]
MKTSSKQLAMAISVILSGTLLTACDTRNSNERTETVAAEQTEHSETQRLHSYFSEQFEAELARSPLSQTYLGKTEDKEAYGQWDDVSDEAIAQQLIRAQQTLATLRTDFDREQLNPAAKVSYDFAIAIAMNTIRQAEFNDHRYVFTQFFGPHTDMSTVLIGYHSINSTADAEAYISRLESFDETLNLHTQRADDLAAAGVQPPSFAYPIIIETAQGLISGAPFSDGDDSALWADFNAKIAELDVSESVRQELLAEGKDALLYDVLPAYQHLIATMNEHAQNATDDDGVWKLPRGEDFYQAQLEEYTTRTDLDANDIHELGLAEVDRIHTEMRAIMAAVGFEGSLQQFFSHLRTSPEFYYADNEAGRQAYLAEAERVQTEMLSKAPEYFNTLPQANLEIRPVEPYRIKTATGAFYEPGSLDGTRPGAYYVNMSNMSELPAYQLETLAYHEGSPGHHFQSSISQELTDAPMFQRLAWYSAYGEGWALYSEMLGKDMGFFTDPYQDFGRLSYEVFRAARLVVDSGIHSKRWTEQEARDYMLMATPMTQGDIEAEVRRYIVWPGQAVSYKVGMLTIWELRSKAQNSLGDRFDWGEFHDVILTNGSVPLSLLTQLVDEYIAEKLSS